MCTPYSRKVKDREIPKFTRILTLSFPSRCASTLLTDSTIFPRDRKALRSLSNTCHSLWPNAEEFERPQRSFQSTMSHHPQPPKPPLGAMWIVAICLVRNAHGHGHHNDAIPEGEGISNTMDPHPRPDPSLGYFISNRHGSWCTATSYVHSSE